jgi:putative nucleotidyltransferase with HDIG domain
MQPEAKTIRIDRVVFQQTLEKKLADLPPLPAVVAKITMSLNDLEQGADELSRMVSMDQGLCSKILRIVNSAYYGFPKRISTITHAIMILGFNTVRNLVLGVSAFGLLPQKAMSAGLNRTKFWEHSIAVAVAASIVAKRRSPNARNVVEEAFIAGLLHDIGKLFLDCYFPVQYAVCMAFSVRENISVFEAERRVLDVTHPTVGKRIAEQWNFPPLLSAAIADHQDPVKGSDNFEIAAIICTANYIAWQADKGSGDVTGPGPLPEAVAEWLGFSDQDFEWVMTEWKRQFAGAQDLLQLAKTAQAQAA